MRGAGVDDAIGVMLMCGMCTFTAGAFHVATCAIYSQARSRTFTLPISIQISTTTQQPCCSTLSIPTSSLTSSSHSQSFPLPFSASQETRCWSLPLSFPFSSSRQEACRSLSVTQSLSLSSRTSPQSITQSQSQSTTHAEASSKRQRGEEGDAR